MRGLALRLVVGVITFALKEGVGDILTECLLGVERGGIRATGERGARPFGLITERCSVLALPAGKGDRRKGQHRHQPGGMHHEMCLLPLGSLEVPTGLRPNCGRTVRTVLYASMASLSPEIASALEVGISVHGEGLPLTYHTFFNLMAGVRSGA